MKKLLFLLLLIHGLVLNAQKNYLDENKIPINDTTSAKFYKIIELDNNTGGYKELYFYISGEKESETYYVKSLSTTGFVQNGKSLSWYENGRLKSEANNINGKRNGKELTYYENGQLKSDLSYKDDKHEGEIVTYWKNGKLKRKDIYNNGKFEYGNCYDSLGNEIKHFEYEIMPQYKGGDSKLLSDIANNIDYPTSSKNAGIQGRVVVRFAVNSDGTISSVDILKGVSPELNKEAMRVVKTLKKFKPGYQDGEAVPVFYMVPITFSLK
jgi:TonB family protein